MAIRPALERFVDMMEIKLQAHDDTKGAVGWRNMEEDPLLKVLEVELLELQDTIREGDPESIILEAVDVANYAMMIADNRQKAAEGS